MELETEPIGPELMLITELIRIIRLEFNRRHMLGVCCAGRCRAAINTLRKLRGQQ
jgi:hypothetical protein